MVKVLTVLVNVALVAMIVLSLYNEVNRFFLLRLWRDEAEQRTNAA